MIRSQREQRFSIHISYQSNIVLIISPLVNSRFGCFDWGSSTVRCSELGCAQSQREHNLQAHMSRVGRFSSILATIFGEVTSLFHEASDTALFFSHFQVSSCQAVPQSTSLRPTPTTSRMTTVSRTRRRPTSRRWRRPRGSSC